MNVRSRLLRRGHTSKLFKKRRRLDIRKYAFSNLVVDKIIINGIF